MKTVFILGITESIFLKDYYKQLSNYHAIYILSAIPGHISLGTNKEIINSFNKALGKKNKILRHLHLFYWGLNNFNRRTILHIHGLSSFPLFLSFASKIKRSSVVITFWGTDLFTNEKKYILMIKKVIVRIADKISLSTLEMKDYFLMKYSTINEKKIYKARFALPNFEAMVRFEKKFQENVHDRVQLKIGYNKRPQQNHLKILNALNNLPQESKNRIRLVLPMTYGEASSTYISQVQNKLNQIDISYKINNNFLDTEEQIQDIYQTDIFINMQETDAQSSTMQEHLFAGARVIVGNWLPYGELVKSGCNFTILRDFDQIPKAVEKLMDVNKDWKKTAEINRKQIESLSSWSGVLSQWLSLYE